MTRLFDLERIAHALAIGFLVAAGAHAQGTTIWSTNGTLPDENLGTAIGIAGDINVDGLADYGVGAPGWQSGTLGKLGRVTVHSGASGAQLLAVQGTQADSGFGRAIAFLGDVNADGRHDFIVGAPFHGTGGRVNVISGLNGVVLLPVDGPFAQSWFGYSVAGVGDVNEDGKADILVGAPRANVTFTHDGRAELRSGIDGSLVMGFSGAVAHDQLGHSVASLGLIDGDLISDFAVGAPQPGDGATPAGKGYVRVYSGGTGQLLLTLQGSVTGSRFGHSVSRAGDVDLDGITDIVVGAPGDGTGAGLAYVYSGASGTLIHTLTGAALFGSSVSDGGDLNMDGSPDVLIGAPGADWNGNTAAGQIVAVSGQTGSALFVLGGTAAGDAFGSAVTGGFDISGDGFADILGGSPLADPSAQSAAGRATALSGGACLPPPVTYCATAPNSVGSGALISSTGSIEISHDNFFLNVAGCPPDVFGLFYYGSTQIQIPFGDGWRCVGGNSYRLPMQFTNPSGDASVQLDFATPPQPAGQILAMSTWNFQFWYRDVQGPGGTGFNLSNALKVSFCP